MPCNSDYMRPTEYEKNSQQVARLLLYVFDRVGSPNKAIRKKYKEAAKDIYANGTDLDKATALLCKTLRTLDKSTFNRLVYNARHKGSRELATWWEEHVAADKRRALEEKARLERVRLRKSALKKLTKDEREALGISNLALD